MLKAALVSWTVTHIMNKALSNCAAITKHIWENAMNHVTLVVMSVGTLVVNTICSAVIVVGACLEWLANVARAVGISCFCLCCKFTSP